MASDRIRVHYRPRGGRPERRDPCFSLAEAQRAAELTSRAWGWARVTVHQGEELIEEVIFRDGVATQEETQDG